MNNNYHDPASKRQDDGHHLQKRVNSCITDIIDTIQNNKKKKKTVTIILPSALRSIMSQQLKKIFEEWNLDNTVENIKIKNIINSLALGTIQVLEVRVLHNEKRKNFKKINLQQDKIKLKWITVQTPLGPITIQEVPFQFNMFNTSMYEIASSILIELYKEIY